MNIRQLKSGEEQVLIAVTREFNNVELPETKASELLRDKSFVMIVAEQKSKIIGRAYGHILRRPELDDFFLYEIDVTEDHQREGAGRAMVEFFSSMCRERRLAEMFVATEVSNGPANALYRSTGGVEEGSPANIFVYKLQQPS